MRKNQRRLHRAGVTGSNLVVFTKKSDVLAHTAAPRFNSRLGFGQGSSKENVSMNRQFTAVIEREGNGYISFCPEVDVASQGDTVQEASANLREAVELFFESASPDEISRRLHSEVYITQLEVVVG